MNENTRLMNEYCTLVNKIFAFIQEYFDGIVPAGRPDPEIYHKTKAIYEQLENWGEDSEGKECRKDAAQVLLEEYLVFAEAYFAKGNPWENRENNRSICRNTVLNSVQMIANLTVWLNSPGGDVFAASQIYSMLKNHKGKVTVKIDGIAASAASVVAMAGDETLIAPTAMMMIHDPSTVATGNKADMEKAITLLEEVNESIINAYETKSHLSRNKIAKMKQIPVSELINGKKLLFVDDSIVRGTQLRETVEFLYENGAEAVHMRSACPPIMYGCKYLNFSRNTDDLELIARRTIMELEGEDGFNYIDEYSDASTERGQKLRKRIAKKFKFDSLEFQSLEGIIKAIGIDPCKLCTYCWNGKG